MAYNQVWILRLLSFAFALSVTIAFEALAGALPNDQIEISLGQDAARISGVSWSESDLMAWDMGSLQKRADVTIRLPDGRTYRSPSEITSFTRNKGRIAGVILTPLRKLTTFEGAVAGVRGIAKALGVENDAKLRTRIREWETGKKGRRPGVYSGGCDLGKEVWLYIEIREHPSGGGYYLSVEISSLKLMEPKELEGGRGKTGR